MRIEICALLALAFGTLAQHVVQFNVTRGQPDEQPGVMGAGSLSRLSRRATYTEDLINHLLGGGYFVQVQLGTPGQTLAMLVDTGSSDAWVLGHRADLCTNPTLQELYGTCAGTYDPDKSSTHRVVQGGGFKITYLDGGVAAGEYITDDFSIGGTTIKSLQVAHVTRAVRGFGILGLGFSENEKAVDKYPNVIDQLANQGLVGCKAYSLYLNDRRTDGGSLLFGGIDTDKFIGNLEVLPILRPNNTVNYTSFEIGLDDMSLHYTNGTSHPLPISAENGTLPALLDSGTTLSYLPDVMATSIFGQFGVVFDPSINMTLVDCAYLNSEPNLQLRFRFGGKTIAVPVWELVLDVLTHTPRQDIVPFAHACLFGIQSTDLFERRGSVPAGTADDFALLGDTFLRSAYVVFDLAHHEIGIAQANLNSSAAAVVELHANDAGLPSASGVAAQQTTHTPTPRPIPTSLDPNSDGSSNENAASRPLAPSSGAIVTAVLTGILSVAAGWGHVTLLIW